MERIDAHQHFWNYDEARDGWITDEMQAIKKNFLPRHLFEELRNNSIEGCVTVQSVQSEEENEFQLHNASRYDFVKGVVGWVDLQAKNVEARLENYSQITTMKGFRHVLQGEPQRDLMLQKNFMHGIGLLEKFGFTYDLLIHVDQLRYTYELVKAFPNQRFVLDHIAKPNIKDQEIEEWKRGIVQLATCRNVYCKISGMVTEANWQNWTQEDFIPYLDVVTDAFGPNRLMFGSDWPVCLVAGDYRRVLQVVTNYYSSFSAAEQEMILGRNAIEFYKLNAL